MKNFIVPFMAMTLLMVSDASAQCAGGYGTGFGFQSNNCNFASSLWTDYCNGGPTMPASARACGCGCNLFSRNGCGGGCGGGLMSHVHGLLGRLGSGGSGSCCGSSWGGYNYPGYTVQGFGAYAGTVPYFGNPGCGSTWWYGGGSYGRPARCGNRGCHVASGCRTRHHCGGGLGLFSHFRNRLAYSSWIGGGPLDTYSLVAGYGGFVGSQLDYGCINGACGGDFGVPMPAGCGCDGGVNQGMPVVQYGNQVSTDTHVQSYSAGGTYDSQNYAGAIEQYAPVEEIPVEEGPFYQSNPIESDSAEEIPTGNLEEADDN